jgi:hypothetical protein
LPPATRRPKAKTPAVTITFEDLADFDESKNIMIVGDSGAGKTVLSGGAPDMLFLALENGTISAKRQGSKAKMVRITDWPSLEAKMDEIDRALEAGDTTFKWLCVDSLPKMQQMLRQNLLNIGIQEGRKGASLDSLQLQDYNEWYNKFLRFVDRLIDMPINVIFTSTSMRIEAEDDEGMPQDIVLPAIEGKAKEGYKLAQSVCAAMSCVWFLNIEGKGDKKRRVIYTQRRPPYFAKDRYGVLPARVVLAPNDITTMARILDKIDNGEVLAEAEPAPDGPELEDMADDELEDEEPEPAPKPTARRTRAKKPEPEPEPVEDDDEDDDLGYEDEDEEPEPAPKPRTSRAKAPAAKASARRGPARTAARRGKPEPVEDDDDLNDDLTEDDDDY